MYLDWWLLWPAKSVYCQLKTEWSLCKNHTLKKRISKFVHLLWENNPNGSHLGDLLVALLTRTLGGSENFNITGLKVNDWPVAYATRLLAVQLKIHAWSHHRTLKAKVQCNFSSDYSPDHTNVIQLININFTIDITQPGTNYM